MENYIREWRERRGLSRRELAEKASTGESQIVKLERGERRLTDAWMARLARALDIEPVDLIVRRGEEALKEEKPKSARVTAHHQAVREIEGVEYAFLPRFDIRASAGYGALVEDDGYPLGFQPFECQWLRGITAAPLDRLALIRVSGDSMWETLHDGDHVLVDRSKTNPTRDGIYVLRYGDELLVKRLMIRLETGLLDVISDNPRYPAQTVSPSSISVLGRVVWIGRQI